MPREAFHGDRRRLVLAFDIGTTFSGISYTILDPGEVPEVRGVTRFLGNEECSGKVPSVIYYDKWGKVCSVGAEATGERTYQTAHREGWIKAEWFKLHLSPETGASKLVKDKLPPLPLPLYQSIVDIIADFLRYLFQCASSYIKEAHANGEDLWSSVEDEITFVLTHPNGWEKFQQSQMRQAALLAGLITDDEEGYARILFLTESEASLHFAIQNGLSMKKGEGVVVVDAGGGTIDVSAFRNGKDAFKETGNPESHFHGSIFVSVHARTFLDNYLADSAFIDDLDHIVRCFDTTTKLRFRSDNQPQYIKFGSWRDNDSAHRIRFGQLTLDGSHVREFFRPSIKCITEVVMEQRKSAGVKVAHVVLVGGFTASDWLRNEVQKMLRPYGLDTIRPEKGVSKAVSDGAILFYLNDIVRKLEVSSDCVILPFYPSPECLKYSPLDGVNTYLVGQIIIPRRFWIPGPCKTRVAEKKFREVRVRFHHESESELLGISTTLSRYIGEPPFPTWINVKDDMFDSIFTTTADLSQEYFRSMQHKRGRYYHVDWEVIMLLGLKELRCQYCFIKDGIEKRGHPSIIYAPDRKSVV